MKELPVTDLPLLHPVHLVVSEEQSANPILDVDRRRQGSRLLA
jgi:hypothetical protein